MVFHESAVWCVVFFCPFHADGYSNQDIPSSLPSGEPVVALRIIGDVAAFGTATSAMTFLEFSDADIVAGRRTSSQIETWNVTRVTHVAPELVSALLQLKLLLVL